MSTQLWGAVTFFTIQTDINTKKNKIISIL